jgi:conflict system pore-forming effector with SLATT domain
VGESLELERARVGSPTTPAPPNLDPKAYLQSRVYQQVNEYYRPKAKENAELAERFRWAGIAMAGLAAILSAVATFVGTTGGSTTLGPWVAVLTTIGGSISTHAAAGRYDFQATTYFATARQLIDLAQGWQVSGRAAPSKEWSEFVRDCEEVISAENRGWMAKLDQQ